MVAVGAIGDEDNGSDSGSAYIFDANSGGTPNEAPVASFDVNRKRGRAPLNVVFDASGSADLDGTIVAYDWDFDDGTSDSGVAVSHLYTTRGRYTATLTVTDDGGLTDTAFIRIKVR